MDYGNVLNLKTNFTPMGLTGLDHILAPGRLVVIASHPNHGADTLAVNTARTATIKHGIPTLLTSCLGLESDLLARIAAAESGVPVDHIASLKTDEQETARVKAAAEPIEAAPLYLNCTDHWMSGVLDRIAKVHAQVAVIEAAHLLLDTEPYVDDEDRAEWQSRELKQAAMHLGIPIVASVPLVEGADRAGGFLRDFGYRYSFAQHADVVLMTHRPEVSEGWDRHDRFGEIDITIAKHRNGPADKVTAWFQAVYDRVLDFPF